MKKIIYLFAALSIAFTACTPLEDIYDELDAQGPEPIVGDVVYTLTDEDYTEDVEDGGLGLRFPNLGSEDEAKEKLPQFLSNKYTALGEGSSALITYKLYNKKNDEKSLEVYTVTSADYAAGGHSFGNFDSFSDITEFLDTKYPMAAERLLVSLTYKYYSGSVATLNNGFLYLDGAWEMIEGFTDDEYTTMGEGFSNFSSEDEAFEKIPLFLKDKFKFEGKEAGDIEGIMYKLYVTDTLDIDNDGRTNDRATYSYVAYFIYDGVNWSKYNNTIDQTLQLGFENGVWAPDNTIKYTLTGDDYNLVSSELENEAGYENAASNLARFGNFNRTGSADGTEPSGTSNWNDIMIVKALGVVLNNINPNAEEGQKYLVTFDMFNGSSGTEQFAMIKTNGEWVLQ